MRHVNALSKEWGDSINLEIEINREVQASVETAKLTEADKQRDDLITYLFQAIRNEVTSPLKARREAAERLVLVVNRYKGLQNEAVDSETLHIIGLLADLGKDAAAADLQALGLDFMPEKLADANTQYQVLQSQRTDTRATTKLPPSKEVRPVTDAVYYRICQLIEASYLLGTVEADRQAIAALVTQMNQLIAETKATFNQREGIRKANKDKDTKTEA